MAIQKNNGNIIRQNIPRDPENPVPHLTSGYPEQPEQQPDDFFIPPCGIVDCDLAIKKLFTNTLPFSEYMVNTANGPINLKKPAVIFASGERYAMIKRLKPVKDKNGALILPAISIRNTGIEQTYEDMSSRGMNQTTGDIVIKRRFDPSDVGYQQLLNKLNLKNVNDPGTTTRSIDASPKEILLDPVLGNNVWEIITMPQPQFIICNYEIVFWATYSDHMNYMIETLISAQLPQVKGFKLVADSGYWFIGYLEESIENRDNSEDSTEEKRIVRRSFNMKVHGYILPSSGIDRKVPIRRYISAPSISFDVYDGDVESKKELDRIKEKTDPFLLTDVTETPIEDQQNPTTMDKFLVKKQEINSSTGKEETKYVKVVEKTGRETVYRASDPKFLQEFFYPRKR